MKKRIYNYSCDRRLCTMATQQQDRVIRKLLPLLQGYTYVQINGRKYKKIVVDMVYGRNPYASMKHGRSYDTLFVSKNFLLQPLIFQISIIQIALKDWKF